MNFNDVTVFSIKASDYRIHFCYMSEDDAISIVNNSNLNEKSGFYKFFLLYIKMIQETYYQKYTDVLLKRAKKYYESDKEILRKQAKDKYRELFEEKNT